MDVNVILKVPKPFVMGGMPEAARQALMDKKMIYPGDQMPGTVVKGGFGLLYICIRDGSDLQSMEDFFTEHGQAWQVLGMKSVKPQPVYDAEGNPVMIDDGQGGLVHKYEVIVYKELDALAIKPFIAPSVDENGVETPRTGKVQLSQFAISGRDTAAWSITV